MVLSIKYKKDSDAKSPSYAYEGDAGLDIFSNEEKTLLPNHRTPVKTGVYFEIPKGYVGLVWDKGGVSLRQGMHTMAGVLDSNYRGELKIVLINLSSQPVKIEKGVKIAQLLIQKIETAKLEEIQELSNTVRNEKAFGSSGLFSNSILSTEPEKKEKPEKQSKSIIKLKPKARVKLKKSSLKEIKRAIKE